MRMLVGIICAVLLLPSIAVADWHHITLTEWKDKNGGGKSGYPKNERGFQEWVENGTVLLVNGSINKDDVAKVKSSAITDVSAKQMKKDVFGISDVQSGVTQ